LSSIPPTIRELSADNRGAANSVLEQSFEGWYLWHAKRTLKDVEQVFAAYVGETIAGVSMLKMLESNIGYVYYIAVSSNFRRHGIGRSLLKKSNEYFLAKGADLVFAGISEDNEESKGLFSSQGFEHITFSELGKSFGRLKAVVLYRKMTIVSGEIVYVKRLTHELPLTQDGNEKMQQPR
jgi:ribosomal protein S18 acetylase RimI-like enzyme